MSLNLEDLRVMTDVPFAFRAVSESEIIGLAVQLLIEKGAVEEDSGYPWGSHPWVAVPTPGRYLVVPLSILGDEK